jgi:hypothetical protein
VDLIWIDFARLAEIELRSGSRLAAFSGEEKIGALLISDGPLFIFFPH